MDGKSNGLKFFLMFLIVFQFFTPQNASRVPRSPEAAEELLSRLREHLSNKLFNNNYARSERFMPFPLKPLNEEFQVQSVAPAEGDLKIGIPGPIPIDIETIKKIAKIIGYIGNQLLPSLLDPINEGEQHTE